MTIYLDFDGTVVSHRFPNIGEYNVMCKKVILSLLKEGHTVILNTKRVEFKNEQFLNYALMYVWKAFDPYKIEHTKSKYIPQKWDWRRMFDDGKIYIDDIAEGIPLKKCEEGISDVVDFMELDKQFRENGIY